MKKDKDLESLKEYIKKHPLKTKTEKSRKKKDIPIPIEACLINFNKNTKKEDATIKLKVAAKPEDWKKLADYVDREGFGWVFWNHFINPALRKCKIKPRWKHKQTHRIVTDIKNDANMLIAFFLYWCKYPTETWPQYLQEIKDMIKNEDYESYVKNKEGKYIPARLTEVCLKKKFDERLKYFKQLKIFQDYSDNFSITYIDNKKVQKYYKQFFENKTPQEVTNLVYVLPTLNNIFTTLEVI